MRFSGTRGYSSYSGRSSKGKRAIAVLLVLVILGAAGFALLQNRVYYDADGKAHLRRPQKETEVEQPLSPEDVELVIETGKPDDSPAKGDQSTTKYASAFLITEETMAQGADAVNAAWLSGMENCQAGAVTLKDDIGRVWFDAASAIPGSVSASGALSEAVRNLAQSSQYTIARISTLHDPMTAKQWVTDMGLRNRSGYIFYDGNNSQWLDANKPRTRQKICELVAETAQLGFDEILLTDLTYPTEGNLENVNDGGVNRAETLEAFLREIRAALPEGVKLSLELPAETILNGENAVAGHVLKDLVPLVDAIYVKTDAAEVAALQNAVVRISKDCAVIPELSQMGSYEGACLLIP